MTVERRNKELDDGWRISQDSLAMSRRPRAQTRKNYRARPTNNYQTNTIESVLDQDEIEHYEALEREAAAANRAERAGPSAEYTRYFSRARLGRAGYILFYPITMLTAFILIGFGQVIAPRDIDGDLPGLNMAMTAVGALFAFIMVGNNVSRRFKDIGVTGWAGLSVAIPWLGVLIALAIAFIPGTNGPNKNGPPPAPLNIGKTMIILAVLVALAITAGNLGFDK